MKSFISTIIVISALAVLTVVLAQSEYAPQSLDRFLGTSRCDIPLAYSIGTVDSRFGLTRQELTEKLNDAEVVWESEFDRELFEYNPDAQFSVNLIYDERQRMTQQTKEAEEYLNSIEGAHEDISQRYEQLVAEYEEEKQRYATMVADYEERLEAYNSEVRKWNERGGAPKEKRQELEEEKQALEGMQAELETQRTHVNSLIEEVNALARQSNELAEIYNEEARTYVNRYGSARKFNQGDYRGDEINIYQFEGPQDLKLVIAHELGHAAGVEHVDNPEAVMYHLMRDQNLNNITLASEDVTALVDKCRLEHPYGDTATTTQD